MTQSRTMSLIEAIANVVVGYGVAVLTQILVFPLFGLRTTLSQNLAMGLVFTGVSLVRSYALRRLFEAAASARTKAPRPRGAGNREYLSGRRTRDHPVTQHLR